MTCTTGMGRPVSAAVTRPTLTSEDSATSDTSHSAIPRMSSGSSLEVATPSQISSVANLVSDLFLMCCGGTKN